MKITSASAFVLLALFISACSDKDESNQASESAAPASSSAPATNTTPPGHPDMNSPEMQQRLQQGMEQMKNNPAAPQVLGAGSGTVVKVMHSAGYTYMEVELGDKKTWVAATTMKIKSGDTVKWQGASVMKNFSSKSLHRTFEEILFVSHASKG